MELNDRTLAVVGVGYVGLPLVTAFGAVRRTIGYDLDCSRIDELRAGFDRTREVPPLEIASSPLVSFTCDARDIAVATIYVVAVPTPVDADRQPDLGPLMAATATVASVLAHGDLVVFESTVYPGATEEVCVPILERLSGLVLNDDFTVGYSPERINPGDQNHRLGDIVKVTSASSAAAEDDVDALYREIIPAGTHRAPSIRVAEAAKVIENTQRDVNIALVNELAMLFSVMGIDTHDVLAAAGTKWNALLFIPGLVGGHCIGVDPYHLSFKALAVGHEPRMILTGRGTNDHMGRHVAERVVTLMSSKGITADGSRCLVLGLAFKENVPDLRNTGVIGLVTALQDAGVHVDVCDPLVDAVAAKTAYDLDVVPLEVALTGAYDSAVLAVGHREFDGVGPMLRAVVGEGVLFDVKGVLPRRLVDGRL